MDCMVCDLEKKGRCQSALQRKEWSARHDPYRTKHSGAVICWLFPLEHRCARPGTLILLILRVLRSEPLLDNA